MVLCESRVDPVMPGQHILVESRIHSLPRPPGRERPSPSHERVENSKGVEVGIEVGGALAGQDHMGEVRERVGTHDWWPLSLHLGDRSQQVQGQMERERERGVYLIF